MINYPGSSPFFGQIKCILNRYQATFKWFMHLPPSLLTVKLVGKLARSPPN